LIVADPNLKADRELIYLHVYTAVQAAQLIKPLHYGKKACMSMKTGWESIMLILRGMDGFQRGCLVRRVRKMKMKMERRMMMVGMGIGGRMGT
jgi:hypothetical protein